MTPDVCQCGAVRKPHEQWFTVPHADDPERRLCPACAPPDLVAHRKASRLRFLRRGP